MGYALLYELERELGESLASLKRRNVRVAELEQKVSYLEKELSTSKEAAATNEQRLNAELTTLVELYKESSVEWSKKAGELEGVIKALEDGEIWTFTVRSFNSPLPERAVIVNYDGFTEDVRIRDELLADGGMARFEVIEKVVM